MPPFLGIELEYSDGWDFGGTWGHVTDSWGLFDVTSHLRTDGILLAIQLEGGGQFNDPNGTSWLVSNWYDDVSILYTPEAPPTPTPIGVKVNIHNGSSPVQYVNSSDHFCVTHGFAVANWSGWPADVQSAFLDPQQNNFTLQTSAQNFQNPPLTHFTDSCQLGVPPEL